MSEQARPPLVDLYLGYDQWKEQRDELRRRLQELCKLMRWNPGNFDYPYWGSHHRTVHDKFIAFMVDWQENLERNRRVLYPIAKTALCGGRMIPAAALEQEDAIAGHFYEAYLQAVNDGESPEDCLSRLHQVLLIISEHFRTEDETLVPAAERLMDEIEYGRN